MIFRASISVFQRRYSRAWSAVNSDGVLPTTSMPCSASCLATVSVEPPAVDFRSVPEGETAARAALSQDRHLLHAITARRRLFEAAVAQGRPAIDEDIAFHRAIAEAGGNRFFVLTMVALRWTGTCGAGWRDCSAVSLPGLVGSARTTFGITPAPSSQ